MILKSFLLFLIALISSSVFARKSDWLNQYLNSKSFKCKLSQDELKDQVQAHVDRNIKQLQTSLAERGSQLQSITQQRDQIEIGVFPEAVGLDFYILEPVTVVLGQPDATFVFQIQSTYYLDEGQPTIKRGLWFPLAVQDPGSDKPCELVRAVVNETERRYLPSIDLTMGNPPRTLVSHLIDVMDVAPASSIMERWPKPSSVRSQSTTSPEVSPNHSDPDDEREEKPKKKRHERHRHRSHYHHRRYHYHYRRHRHDGNQTPTATEPAQPQNECSGEISTWKAVTCTLSGQKTD